MECLESLKIFRVDSSATIETDLMTAIWLNINESLQTINLPTSSQYLLVQNLLKPKTNYNLNREIPLVAIPYHSSLNWKWIIPLISMAFPVKYESTLSGQRRFKILVKIFK